MFALSISPEVEDWLIGNLPSWLAAFATITTLLVTFAVYRLSRSHIKFNPLWRIRFSEGVDPDKGTLRVMGRMVVTLTASSVLMDDARCNAWGSGAPGGPSPLRER